MPADKALSHLQETLLKAVLLGEPLPGWKQPIRFPDLSFMLGHPAIFLLDTNLPGPIRIEGYSKPIRILSEKEILQESHQRGDIAYFQFQPPEGTDDPIRLTLEARIASRDPGQRVLGLSNIQVTFSKSPEGWKAVEGPVYSAA
jgi:hypothetical protein